MKNKYTLPAIPITVMLTALTCFLLVCTASAESTNAIVPGTPRLSLP